MPENGQKCPSFQDQAEIFNCLFCPTNSPNPKGIKFIMIDDHFFFTNTFTH